MKKAKEIKTNLCYICHQEIPIDHACIYVAATGEVMCCSHEGQKIDVWILVHEGAHCVYRKKSDAAEDIACFKENCDEYTFKKTKIKCTELLGMGEFVGW